MSITVTGLDELELEFSMMAMGLNASMPDIMKISAEMVRGDAIKSIAQVSKGETIRRLTQGGNEGEHTVSKPGDAPNTRDGDLVSGISTELENTGSRFQFRVVSSAPYSAALEFGTKDATLAPRPFLRPAFDKNEKKIISLISKAVNKATK